MHFSHVILLIISFFLSAFCNTPENGVEYYPYKLGATKVITERFSFPGEDSVHLLLLHSNEHTAKTVASDILQQTGGTLLSISNRGQRLIKFTHKKRGFEFDPNRIFTPAGRYATLQKNGSHTEASERILAGFAAHLLQLIKTDTVISLHNNTDGAFSINNYTPGGVNAKDATQVHTNNNMDADNFFLTTDENIYKKIKAHDVNIVLQDNGGATDDGSLSVYCGHSGIPYINIEAQHGHVKQQAEMLKLLMSVLKN